MQLHTPTCYICGNHTLEFILSLGQVPDKNNFLLRDPISRPQTLKPLVAFFCSECALMQITQPSPVARRFETDVSVGRCMGLHEQGSTPISASDLIKARSLHRSSLVVNVGAGDRNTLNGFVEQGISVLDVRPGNGEDNRDARQDRAGSIPSFTASLASRLRGQAGAADVIIERDVLERTDDPGDFVEGVRILLRDDGLAVIDVPYVRDSIDQCAFDFLGHDRPCYFSFTALNRLFARHSLFINHVERIPENGGSLRLYVGHRPTDGQACQALLQEETHADVDHVAYYRTFAARAQSVRDWLLDLLWGVKSRGGRIAAYWADVQGATILNYAGIGSELLDFVADPRPERQGFYIAGKGLPIKSCARLMADMPDYVLLLRWRDAAEIIERESDYLERGGVFVTPLPYPVCTSQRTRERVRC